MDNTYIFRQLCQAVREQNSIPEPVENEEKDQSRKNNDPFTSLCVSIRSDALSLRRYLNEVRKTYLTSTPEAEEVDVYTREIITSLMTRIRQLEGQEKHSMDVELNSGSALMKFVKFADPKVEQSRRTLNLHRNGMLCYLNDTLKAVSDTHAEQNRLRIQREMHKTKSTLQYVPAAERDNVMQFEREVQSAEDNELRDLLGKDLLLELESENSALLEEMQVTQDKVRQAEKSMMEIAELQTQMAAHLSSQNDMIRSLMEDAQTTTEQVGAANVQLSQARKRNRFASKIIIVVSLFLGTVLLILDAL